jgi:hypothetical protein
MVSQRVHGPATPQAATTGQLSQKLVSAKHRAEDVKSDFPSDSDSDGDGDDEDKPAAKGVTQSQLNKYVGTTPATGVRCAGGQVLMTPPPPRHDQTGAQGVNVVVQQRRRRARGGAADGRQGNQGQGQDTQGQECPKTRTRRTKVAQDV